LRIESSMSGGFYLVLGESRSKMWIGVRTSPQVRNPVKH